MREREQESAGESKGEREGKKRSPSTNTINRMEHKTEDRPKGKN